jgi:hypothetical protein
MKTIKLTKGYEAIVSDEDYDDLIKYSWRIYKDKCNCYATRSNFSNGKQGVVSMHSQIMKTPKGMHTDHINGNGLDNTRENLRVVTCRQNAQNRHSKKTSQYVGVHWVRNIDKWKAQILINGVRKRLGTFNDELAAYKAYLKALEEIGEICIKELGGKVNV